MLEGHRERIRKDRPKQTATGLPQLSAGWQPTLSSCASPNPHALYLQSVLTLAFGIPGVGLPHTTCPSQAAEGKSHRLHKNWVFFSFPLCAHAHAHGSLN